MDKNESEPEDPIKLGNESEPEDPIKPGNKVLHFLYAIGLFLFEFAILGRIFSSILGNHYMVMAAILVWKLGGLKGWIMRKCKEYLNERLVGVIESISNCFVYMIEFSIWIFYMFITLAWRLFWIIFFVTLAVKCYGYMTNQRVPSF